MGDLSILGEFIWRSFDASYTGVLVLVTLWSPSLSCIIWPSSV